ncbi:hypothetical protein B0H13DRAFT_2314310 [Mycena leptocephala]|nr:hypothetical protein B0H13DRAFT_2314310 [Mycena leptocephala]
MSEYVRTNRVVKITLSQSYAAKPSLTPVNQYSGRTSALPFCSPSFLAHLPAVSSSCLFPHEAETCFFFIFKNHTSLPARVLQAALRFASPRRNTLSPPLDIVYGYGSFFVSIDQHFRQRNSHPRGAETSAAAFHLGSIVV